MVGIDTLLRVPSFKPIFFSSALDLLGGFGAMVSRCGSHNYISIEPNRITKGRTLSRRIILISMDFMDITDDL